MRIVLLEDFSSLLKYVQEMDLDTLAVILGIADERKLKLVRQAMIRRLRRQDYWFSLRNLAKFAKSVYADMQ